MLDPPEPSWSLFNWKTLAGALISVGTGLIAFFGAALTARTKHHEIEANAEVELRKMDIEERMQIGQVTTLRMQQIIADNAALREEVQHHTQDAVRGWNLARFWNGKAHELNHAYNNVKPLLLDWAVLSNKPPKLEWQQSSALPPFDNVTGIAKPPTGGEDGGYNS